jgi:hypothetical protein
MEQERRSGEGERPKPRLPLGRSDLARIAYEAVEGMEFLEMNDGNRLGYHIYLFLNGEISSIAAAVYEAKPRIQIHPKELESILSERLRVAGVS